MTGGQDFICRLGRFEVLFYILIQLVQDVNDRSNLGIMLLEVSLWVTLRLPVCELFFQAGQLLGQLNTFTCSDGFHHSGVTSLGGNKDRRGSGVNRTIVPIPCKSKGETA